MMPAECCRFMNRRKLLKMSGLLAAGGLLPLVTNAQAIPPGMRLVDVRTHGAVGDGKALDTRAINAAIDVCHAAGGGMVYLSPGVYLSGAVVLKSNVTLHLEAGATLLGSDNIDDYIGAHVPENARFKHLIVARDAENIGVVGPGKVDGQGPAYWHPNGKTELPADQQWRDVAAHYWKGDKARPSPLLEFFRCNNVRVEDVFITNAPAWTLRPNQCDYVFIRGVIIKNPNIGPNTDGIDIVCSRNVFISDCVIETDDDAICLKSEPARSDGVPPVKNVVVTNCVLTTCCNAFKIGTGTHGGFENIVFTDSIIVNNNVELKARAIAGIALEMVDGGCVEGVTISNIRMQRVRTPIFIRRGNRTGNKAGSLRGIMISNIQATGAAVTSCIAGIPGFDVEDVTLSNIRIHTEEGGAADWVAREIPEVPNNYPEARMFGRLPSHGLYCRHVRGLRMNSVEFTATPAEARPVIICDDVKDFSLDGLRSSAITGSEPVIKLIQTRDALVRGCSAPTATKVFLEVVGSQSGLIAMVGNDLGAADQAVQLGKEVGKNAVTLAGNITKG